MALNRRMTLLGGGGALLAGGGAAAISFLRMGSSEAYAAAAATSRTTLGADPDLKELVRFATLAANGHNTQPWRFRLSTGRIDILPDFTRRTPVVDPDDHHLYASLGCAAENLSVAGTASGRRGTPRFEAAGDGSVVFEFGPGPRESSALFQAIPRRQSTRMDYDGKPVSAEDLRMLASAAMVPGVDVVLITDRPRLDRMRDLIVAGNTAQVTDAAFVRELKDWIRFNPRDALARGDGLYGPCSGNPTLPAWLGPFMFDMAFKAEAENEKIARQMRSSAGVAVFVAAVSDRDHWVRAGQACQRFALQATALGLKHAFLNQPTEVPRLRPELASLVGLPGRRPNIVMRFGYGPTMPMSPRRPVEAVLV